MIETDPDVERQSPAHAPVVLDEGLDVGKPIISHHAAAFAIGIEIPEEGVGVSILGVIRHGRATAETVVSKVGAGELILFHLAGPFVIKTGLDIVLAPHLTQGVVETVNVVPVGVRTLSAAGAAEVGFIRLLPAAKTKIRDAYLEILAPW